MTAASAPITRGGRRVVLKKLDDDCLLDGQLHPSIRLRLERVRELPARCVANFLGVERDEASVAQMVWEYVPGTPLAEVDAADWSRLVREVILAVESLHVAGIVHGAIHERNVIIDDASEVRLTHVSPLLYTDPEQDAADVIAMFDVLVAGRQPDSALAAMLADAAREQVTLRQLYESLARLNTASPTVARDDDDDDDDDENVERERHPRTRYIVAAALIALIGIAMALAIYWRLTAAESQPYAPPAAAAARGQQ